ncbi:MAG: transposase [Bdellovibrionota bacterium]
MAKFFPQNPTAYGGALAKTRAGRARPRPLTYVHTMHLVFRASKIAGPKPFRMEGPGYPRAHAILKKFAARHGVELRRYVVNLNHIHLHIKIPSRQAYLRFVRAVTSAIAAKVKKYWDCRPFSRVVAPGRDARTMDDYIRLNEMEAFGMNRAEARFYLALEKADKLELSLERCAPSS